MLFSHAIPRVVYTARADSLRFLLRSRACRYWQFGPRRRPAVQVFVLSSASRASRCVCLIAPSAPAIQIFITAVRAFDRGQLITKVGQRFAARCRDSNRDDSSARSVLAQPPNVGLTRYHLLRRPDIDTAQRGSGGRFVCWRTLAFCRTFDRHWRPPIRLMRRNFHRCSPPCLPCRARTESNQRHASLRCPTLNIVTSPHRICSLAYIASSNVL